jgi:antitoxin PrlF
MKAVLSEKGQVTVPKACRDRLGLRPGAVLDFAVEGGKLVGAKVEMTDSIHAWRGKGRLPGGRTVDRYLAEARA